MSIRNISGDMYEYDLMDQKVIEYLNEILKNVNMAQEKIERHLKDIVDPENCQDVILLLRQESEIELNLSSNLGDFIIFARRIIRVEKRVGKTFYRARAEYESWVLKLLSQAGLTNEQKLLMSFASRLQKLIKKKDQNLAEIEQEYIEG